MKLTSEIVKELLNYDNATGKIYWKYRSPKWFNVSGRQTAEGNAKRWNDRYAGKEAFASINHKGYKTTSLLGRKYFVHRLIWLMFNDKLPEQVDHINGNRLDNRIENLCASNQTMNHRNMKRKKNNKSGLTGAWWWEERQCYQVRIGIGKKNLKVIGYAKTLEEAKEMLAPHREKLGYSERHGI